MDMNLMFDLLQSISIEYKFQLNFAVGITNLLYFLLRLLATEDFLLFMFEMETIGNQSILLLHQNILT